MTATEKSKETRRRNNQRRQERQEAERIDISLAIIALKRVRDSKDSTPAEVLTAIQYIDVLCGYNRLPATALSAPRSGNEPDMEWFAKQVAAIQAKYERPNT